MIDDNFIEYLLQHPKEAQISLLSSFELFIRVFHYYTNRNQFIVKDYHKGIIKRLEDMVFQRNKKNNLYIGICPRSGKSQTSLYFLSWGIAHNPQSNFLSVSYGGELINKFSKQVRNIVSSELFTRLFGVTVNRDSSASDLWKTSLGGEYRATTLQGTITGFGAGSMSSGWGGCIIIDDFLKAQDASSQNEKRKVIECYENTIKSRRNNPNTPIIIIAQRLAEDDLIGHIQESEPDDWDFYIIPTLNDKNESIWEEQFPAEKLLKMKEVNPFLFYSQYQQEPIAQGGNIIKEDWWKFYPTSNVKYKSLFMVADTALKTKEANDFTAMTFWGITQQNELYLIDMNHGKWDAPDLEVQALEFWNKWKDGINGLKTRAFYIEDKASGTGLIQTLKRKFLVPIVAIQRNSDKVTRVYDASVHIENGRVYLPINKDTEISRKVIAEASAFSADMKHKHDDIVDTICDATDIAFRQKRGLF